MRVLVLHIEPFFLAAGVRFDSSTLDRCKLGWSQSYATEIPHRYHTASRAEQSNAHVGTTYTLYEREKTREPEKEESKGKKIEKEGKGKNRRATLVTDVADNTERAKETTPLRINKARLNNEGKWPVNRSLLRPVFVDHAPPPERTDQTETKQTKQARHPPTSQDSSHKDRKEERQKM